MTITEVAKEFDLSADTLRYYEKIGLLAPIPRTKGGIREYGDMECRAVEFIKCMRSAGVSVDALIEYVSLFQREEDTRLARKKILEEQRELLLFRMEELQAALDKLSFKIENYDTILRDAEQKMN